MGALAVSANAHAPERYAGARCGSPQSDRRAANRGRGGVGHLGRQRRRRSRTGSHMGERECATGHANGAEHTGHASSPALLARGVVAQLVFVDYLQTFVASTFPCDERILIRHPAAAMRAPSAAAAVLCFSCAQSCSAYAPGSLTAATRPVMRPAASRSAPSQMLFGRPPPAPPAPPAPPPTTPATAIIQRDLLGYASLLALGVVPAVDWVSLIGPEAVNPARLVYFSLIAVGSVYLGVHYITP